MSSPYTGNPANHPTAFTLPSDGDGPGIKAADVDPTLEGIIDCLSGIDANFTFKLHEFLVGGTLLIPPGVVAGFAWGFGAGGSGAGGGTGNDSTPTTTAINHGGPGSCGAIAKLVPLALTAGETITASIGAPGAAGAAGTGGAGVLAGGNGGDGGDSTLATVAGTHTWKGGQGASGWTTTKLTLSVGIGHLPGANAPAGSPKPRPYVFPAMSASQAGFSLDGGAPNGGAGAGGGAYINGTSSANGGRAGCYSAEGYAGGAGGAKGANASGPTPGGDGGGGGGGGPRGPGGAGGAGGAASQFLTGSNGTAGSSAGANTGAGGGGGGGGGNGGGLGGDGAPGGLGGSGYIAVLLVSRS